MFVIKMDDKNWNKLLLFKKKKIVVWCKRISNYNIFYTLHQLFYCIQYMLSCCFPNIKLLGVFYNFFLNICIAYSNVAKSMKTHKVPTAYNKVFKTTSVLTLSVLQWRLATDFFISVIHHILYSDTIHSTIVWIHYMQSKWIEIVSTLLFI